MSIHRNNAVTANFLNSKVISTVLLASLLGILFTSFFRLYYLDRKLLYAQYPDFGPSLLSGNHPDLLLKLYIVLVVSTTFFATILLFVHPKMTKFLNSWQSVILLGGITTFTYTWITGTLAHETFTPHLEKSGLLLSLVIFILLMDKAGKLKAILRIFSDNAENAFFFIFCVILLFHAPKYQVLNELFMQSGLKYESISFFILQIFLTIMIALLLTWNKGARESFILTMVFIGIYVISIRESWINWGLDAFHEGESLLTVPYLFRDSPNDFFPVHGYGRNIWHGYYVFLFSDNNVYFNRVIVALAYPIVHVLIAACLYKYSRSILLSVIFFVLSYMTGMLEERDIPPLLLIVLLIVPLSNNKNTLHNLRDYVVGMILFFGSLYSIEHFVFINIITLVLILTWLLHTIRRITHNQLANILKAYYLTLIMFGILFFRKADNWINAVLNALEKSPNLLERPLTIPYEFSFTYFTLTILFVCFLTIFISVTVSYFKSSTNPISSADTVFAIMGMLSLMFFVRAFNRSDIAHILYAFSISIPLMIMIVVNKGILKSHHYKSWATLILVLSIVQSFVIKDATLMSLRERPKYDTRLEVTDVRNSEQVGELIFPAATVSDAHVTVQELAGLERLVESGFKIFDMTNQPVLVYGILDNPLVVYDMHTLFFNTYAEQRKIIKSLDNIDSSLVLWSANHWSETLDGTYKEYRLPILSRYILKAYNYNYRIGRFVLLSKTKLDLPEAFDSNQKHDNYNLGFAPSKIRPYDEEFARDLNAPTAQKVSNLDIDALIVELDAMGGGEVVVAVKSNLKIVCQIVFNAPSGRSDNFIRLSNLPCVNRVDTFEVTINAKDAGTNIIDTQFLSLVEQ